MLIVYTGSGEVREQQLNSSKNVLKNKKFKENITLSIFTLYIIY